MKQNIALVSVSRPLLYNKLKHFFKQSDFNIVSTEALRDTTVKKQISFFVVDVSDAQKLLPYILEQKKYSEHILPALIFLSETESPVEWLKMGFDDFLFFKESSELHFVKINKWVLLHQKTLREKSKRQHLLDTLTYNLNAPVIIINKDGNIDDMNQVAVETFGIDKEKILGNHWTLFTPEEYINQLIKVYESINNDYTSGPHFFEFKFYDKLNRNRTWKVSINSDPVSENIVVVMQDTEIYEKSQRAFQQSEQKHLFIVESELHIIRHALNSAASAVEITDIDGNIIWVNKAFTKLTGYAYEEAIGKNSRILESGKHPQEFYKQLWDTILSGKVWKNELINKRKNGSLYHEESTITPVFDKNGKIIRFIAIKQDISEQKKLEEDLKNHLYRQQILNNILAYYLTEGAVNLKNIIPYYLSEIGAYVKADRLYLTEYDGVEMDYSKFYQWSKKDDNSNILSDLNKNEIIAVKNWFLENIKKNVKVCSFSINEIKNKIIKNIFVKKSIGTLICFPMFHEEQRIGFTGFIFSASDYKMSDDEQNLIDVFSYIIINIWLRNASIKELSNAKQKAEVAIKLKTAFLANMNHEIRTPMNAVMGFSDLMKEATCEEKDDYAKIILSSAKQLLKLVNDVIFLSRLQSEKLPITLSKCKPVEIINTVYQMFLVTDENVNNLDIRISYSSSLSNFIFISDIDKIQQVITNFVSNALKYTISGYVEIGFKVEGQKVRFYVKDTGKGIDKEDVPKLFNAFYRTSDVMFSSIRGSGLGLSIAKELIETIGGEIGVNTEPNKGSEFYFTLPNKPFNKKDKQKKTKASISRNWKDIKVLVAEDNENSFLYLKLLLEKKVKIFDRAVDGLQAIKMAADYDYDLILMDIKMPELNGLDAAHHIKIKKPDVLIFAQTAYAMPEEKKQALSYGCDEYLTKPINKELLYDIIEKKVLSSK